MGLKRITNKDLLYSTWNSAAAAKSLQSCPTLCDPVDGSPPGSPIPGILQARTLEWVAISFSNAWKGQVKGKSLSHVRLLATPWTAAHQAPPSMGFSRQEYWSWVPSPCPCKKAARANRWTNLANCKTQDSRPNSVVFLYTSNEESKNEIKKTILCTKVW